MSKHSLTESRVSDKDGFESFPALWINCQINTIPWNFSQLSALSLFFLPRFALLKLISQMRNDLLLQLLFANEKKASLVAQTVKNLPAMQETWVWSLGQEDPLEEEMATCSSILAWRIPWTEEPGGLQSMGLQSQTGLSDQHLMRVN